MRPSKLIPLLKPLTTKQLKRLNEFAQSPFFNKKAEIVAFVQYVTAQAPRWNEKNLTDEKIFQAVFPNEEYDQAKLYYLRSEVIQLTEEFIIYQDVQVNSMESRQRLLNYYMQIGWDSQYESAYKDTQKELEKERRKDAFHYLDRFLLAWNQVAYQHKNQVVPEKLPLPEVIHNLEVFYLANYFSLALSKLQNTRAISSPAAQDFLLALRNYVQQEPSLLEIPAIFIPYSLLQITQQNIDISQFDAILEALRLHHHYFPHDVLVAFYSVLRNYSIAQTNQGNTAFESRSLLLYKTQLAQGLLWDKEGMMRSMVFTNILVLALRVGEIEWVANFVETYQEKLIEHDKNNIANYARAKIAFAQKNYSQVLRFLHCIETYQDVLFQLSCRKLLIQNYFELKEWENVQYQINAFRVFLHRETTLSESKKKFSLNFAIIVNQLMQMKEKNTIPSAKSAEKISQMIAEMGAIGEKKWLMEQVK